MRLGIRTISVNIVIAKSLAVAHSVRLCIFVAHSSLIVLLPPTPFIHHYLFPYPIHLDISNAEYQTRILPHSSLIVLLPSTHPLFQPSNLPTFQPSILPSSNLPLIPSSTHPLFQPSTYPLLPTPSLLIYLMQNTKRVFCHILLDCASFFNHLMRQFKDIPSSCRLYKPDLTPYISHRLCLGFR